MLKDTVHTFVFAESTGTSPFFICQSAGALPLPLTRRRLGIGRAFLAARETLGPGSGDGERLRFDALLTAVGDGIEERPISTSGSGTLELGASGTLELGASGTLELGTSGISKSGTSGTKLAMVIVRV